MPSDIYSADDNSNVWWKSHNVLLPTVWGHVHLIGGLERSCSIQHLSGGSKTWTKKLYYASVAHPRMCTCFEKLLVEQNEIDGHGILALLKQRLCQTSLGQTSAISDYCSKSRSYCIITSRTAHERGFWYNATRPSVSVYSYLITTLLEPIAWCMGHSHYCQQYHIFTSHLWDHKIYHIHPLHTALYCNKAMHHTQSRLHLSN